MQITKPRTAIDVPGCRRLPLAVALALVVPQWVAAQAPDRVKLTDKTEISGRIDAIRPSGIEITDQRDESKSVTIDRIREVVLGDEPEALRSARGLLDRRDPAGALDELGKIEKSELDGASDRVLAEVAFVRAAATGRQATVTGTGLAEGEKALREFLQKHPQSHHVFRTSELLGDLLVRAGKFDDATAAFAALEKGPPAFRVRAAAAKAGVFYTQKKYAEADKEFQVAIKVDTDPNDEASARQKREAQAGRARCLARQGKAAEAIAIVQDVIRAAAPDDADALGRAYASLGDAFRAAGKDEDAIIAFLTVDLVYNSVADCHAEALYNLVSLWQKVQKPERSREARQALETSYPTSRWAKALAAAGGKG